MSYKGEPLQDKVQDKYPEVCQSARAVFAIFRQNPQATAKQICEQLGLKERQVYKHINTLKSFGIIVRVGSNKSGYWKLTAMDESLQ